jgi:hypothetical protein
MITTAETCSCHDVLLSFKDILYAVKFVLDTQVTHNL